MEHKKRLVMKTEYYLAYHDYIWGWNIYCGYFFEINKFYMLCDLNFIVIVTLYEILVNF